MRKIYLKNQLQKVELQSNIAANTIAGTIRKSIFTTLAILLTCVNEKPGLENEINDEGGY